MCYGEGPVNDMFLEGKLKFDPNNCFLFKNNHNFEEQKLKPSIEEEEELIAEDIEIEKEKEKKKTKPRCEKRKLSEQQEEQQERRCLFNMKKIAKKVKTPGDDTESSSDEFEDEDD